MGEVLEIIFYQWVPLQRMIKMPKTLKQQIHNQILDENPFISPRLLIEERDRRFFAQSLRIKPYKFSRVRGYVKQKDKVKPWIVKVLKELKKPAKPKPDKQFWLKKIFGDDCEFKVLSYNEKAEKFWINKRRGVFSW